MMGVPWLRLICVNPVRRGLSIMKPRTVMQCGRNSTALAVGRGLKGDNHDQDIGIRIVLHAMEQPLRDIVANAGIESSLILDKVREGKGGFGYNAQSDTFGDLDGCGGAGSGEGGAGRAAECGIHCRLDDHHRGHDRGESDNPRAGRSRRGGVGRLSRAGNDSDIARVNHRDES
jgi:hypothetical protein